MANILQQYMQCFVGVLVTCNDRHNRLVYTINRFEILRYLKNYPNSFSHDRIKIIRICFSILLKYKLILAIGYYYYIQSDIYFYVSHSLHYYCLVSTFLNVYLFVTIFNFIIF